MNSRTRSRKAVSIGSNQSAKSGPASSASGCRASRFVVGLVMAWSPARRANAGIDRVGQPGDYATPNSNQPRDATLGLFVSPLPQSLLVTSGDIPLLADLRPQAPGSDVLVPAVLLD